MGSDEMKPGSCADVQKGSGNAVVLAVGLWAERPSKSGPIHIHMTGTEKFHTTVTGDSNSERYHRTLFRDSVKAIDRTELLGIWRRRGGHGSSTRFQVARC